MRRQPHEAPQGPEGGGLYRIRSPACGGLSVRRNGSNFAGLVLTDYISEILISKTQDTMIKSNDTKYFVMFSFNLFKNDALVLLGISQDQYPVPKVFRLLKFELNDFGLFVLQNVNAAEHFHIFALTTYLL